MTPILYFSFRDNVELLIAFWVKYKETPGKLLLGMNYPDPKGTGYSC